jgi:hypothetical protein
VATLWLELATDRWDWRRWTCRAGVRALGDVPGGVHDGRVDLDAMIYVSGACRSGAGAGCRLPAPLFFTPVIPTWPPWRLLRSRNVPEAGIFYGPRLPFARRALSLDWNLNRPRRGTVLGRLAIDGADPCGRRGRRRPELRRGGRPPLNLVFPIRARGYGDPRVTITRSNKGAASLCGWCSRCWTVVSWSGAISAWRGCGSAEVPAGARVWEVVPSAR